MANFKRGDLFNQKGLLVIPTNRGKVHGAGLAKGAKDREIIDDEDRVYQLDVKTHWKEKADMNMIINGLRDLIRYAREHPNLHISLPLVGMGHGEMDPETVIPYLKMTQQASPNMTIIVPTKKALKESAQGTARTDKTLENLDKINALLAA